MAASSIQNLWSSVVASLDDEAQHQQQAQKNHQPYQGDVEHDAALAHQLQQEERDAQYARHIEQHEQDASLPEAIPVVPVSPITVPIAPPPTGIIIIPVHAPATMSGDDHHTKDSRCNQCLRITTHLTLWVAIVPAAALGAYVAVAIVLLLTGVWGI
ncbi:expressed unknown protein [Seminavis robusta]|uniref:Uncharacterized protein n=1 Tax=Seminavis robusta TaxID=568900 RepID=A0A9N8D7X4_9STRA|nr:expressed unknown protein [Seminavis robusta]|eukprot:Sro33_g021470.1 n/a (157) ;mRNA; r:84101-84571